MEKWEKKVAASHWKLVLVGQMLYPMAVVPEIFESGGPQQFRAHDVFNSFAAIRRADD